ncbi:MAG: hypothetical protein J7L47_06890, partial [Candidatus Odinarchaeota archaeon]|nr:hypothetical protein [Candidatus Odinarchaeota archaeon]
IKGVVEKVGFTVVDINEVSCQIDGFPACTYEVTLDKSIRKYLEQFIEKRKNSGKKKQNFLVFYSSS